VTDKRRLSSIILSAVVIIAIAVAGTLYLADRGVVSGARMIAFPGEVPESTVLAALVRADIDDAAGISTVLVPLSDFSRIITVPLQNADKRALQGDPRRTPFLDELTLRFSVRGPDNTDWNVLYLPGSSRTRDEAVARELAGLGRNWAWDAAEPEGSSRWLVLPSLAWAVWLITGNPRRDRLRRALWVVSCLPLLLAPDPGAPVLFIVCSAALVVASRHVLSGAAARLALILWPHTTVCVALLALKPGFIPFFGASIVLAVATTYLRPRLERLAIRRWLHARPEFRNLTLSGVHEYASRINRGLLVPVAVTVIMTMVLPSRTGSQIEGAPRFMIEHATGQGHLSADSLFEEHLAFQQAITYGRLGDFSLEDTTYAPVYRYREEGGRMQRFEDSVDTPSDWPAVTFKAAIMVLSNEGPASILIKQGK